MRGTIALCLGGLGDVDLTKGDLKPLVLVLVLGGVLGRLVQDQVQVLPHEFLDGRLDELVEGVELLGHQPFLVEKRQDDGPAVLGRDAACIVVVQVGVVMLGLGHDAQNHR